MPDLFPTTDEAAQDQARDPIEAIRLCAARLYVVRRGKVIAESPRQTTRLHLPGRPGSTGFTG